MKQKTVAIIHFNTPELTQALIKSIRKHGGEEYKVVIFDNSNERPFTKKMKGVKVINNRKGQIIDFEKELAKYPERDEKIGCAKGCYFGSDVHMMSVQKLWELVPEGFMLMDSDILIKAPFDWMFMEDQCCCGYISNVTAKRIPRLLPLLCWVNVPMCKAGGATYFDPNRAWALHQGDDKRNWWDTGAAFLDDIKRLKPQCHGKAVSREQIKSMIEHYGAGSWRKNDLQTQQAWLNEYKDLWE